MGNWFNSPFYNIEWPNIKYRAQGPPVKKICNEMIPDNEPFSATINIIAAAKLSEAQSLRLCREVLEAYKPFEIWCSGNLFVIIWDPAVKYPSLVANIANYIIAQISGEIAVFLHEQLDFREYVVIEVDLFAGELGAHRGMLEQLQRSVAVI